MKIVATHQSAFRCTVSVMTCMALFCVTANANEYNKDAPISRAEVARLLVQKSSIKELSADAYSTLSFWDVGRGHPDFVYIEALSRAGRISGFDDGTFRPNQTVTRAELAAIISTVYKTEKGVDYTYTDILEDSWYAQYVGWFSKAGIFTQSTFKPFLIVTTNEVDIAIAKTKKKILTLEKKNPVPKGSKKKSTAVQPALPKDEVSVKEVKNSIANTSIGTTSFSVTVSVELNSEANEEDVMQILFLDYRGRPIVQKNLSPIVGSKVSHTQVVAKRSRPVTAIVSFKQEDAHSLQTVHELIEDIDKK